MTDEEKKQVVLEMKAITGRIEEDIRILVGTMDEIGQTEISVLIAGWEVHMKRTAEKVQQ